MQTKKYILATVLFIMTAWLAIGCGPLSRQTTQPLEAPTSSNFKVAVLFPQNISDRSWNQAGYEALQGIQQKLGASIAYQENVDVPSGKPPEFFAKLFQDYAKAGYDLIVGHGGQFTGAIEQVAKDFPQTKFAIAGGYTGNNNNAGGITYRTSEAGYLVGVAAGLATKTNTIAFIGAKPLPDSQDFAKFYERGAQSVNPQVKVSVQWVGSFTDTETAAKVANSAIKSGSDVLMIIASQIAPTVIQVAQEAGVKAIAPFNDQNSLAPTTVLTSLLVNYPAIYLQAATLVRQGRWEGKQYRFGLKEGAIELAPFHNQLTPEKEKKVQNVKQDIMLGKLALF